jgi:hypothetical protein
VIVDIAPPSTAKLYVALTIVFLAWAIFLVF